MGDELLELSVEYWRSGRGGTGTVLVWKARDWRPRRDSDDGRGSAANDTRETRFSNAEVRMPGRSCDI